MSARLPPPLLVTENAGSTGPAGEADIDVLRGDGCEVLRAKAFGTVLASARRERGISRRLTLFAAGDHSRRPPPSTYGQIWLPHMFCWQSPREVALAWELSDEGGLSDLIEASTEDVLRWAERPDLLLRLCRLAGDAVELAEQRRHLSFRWLMANQEIAAAALAGESVEVEHVSLHVAAEDEEMVVGALTGAIGFIEIPRPDSITVPGRWLQGGNCKLHLNSRAKRDGERGFPGTAPNHVCFTVTNLPAVVSALELQGFETEQAGSLSQRQVWLRLPGEIVIELQPG